MAYNLCNKASKSELPLCYKSVNMASRKNNNSEHIKFREEKANALHGNAVLF